MLKLAPTRWLSMQHAVERVLENWQVLYNFFQVAKLEDNSKSVSFIFDELNNSCTKAILLFLNYFLNFFNTFNALFQGKNLLVHELSNQCKKLFKQVTSHFLQPEYLNDFKINYKNPRHFLELNKIDLGLDCNNFILDLPEQIQCSIRKSCLEFMITAATEMQLRFPLTNTFFDALKFLNPQIALNISRPSNLTSLKDVWTKFISIDGIDGNKIDREWKNIAINFSEDKTQTDLFLNLRVEEFWRQLGKIKTFNDELEYSNITLLARLCMTLPHSNAETERVFSVVSSVKTKNRNKMGNVALNGVSVVRFSSNNCCQSFKVADDHIKLMNSKNLYDETTN